MEIFGSSIVATALSIVVCWSLFALFCSFIQEVIVRTKSERGRFLRKQIYEQLNDKPNGINWGYLMFIHSNIQLLSKTNATPPSKISPNVLAKTLLDVVGNLDVFQNAGLQEKERLNVSNKFASISKNLSLLASSNVVDLLRHSIASTTPNDPELEVVALEKMEEDLTKWFHQFTEESSNWYALMTRKRLYALGLVLALVFHIDSIKLTQFYFEQPEARMATLSFYEKNKDSFQKLAESLADSTNNEIDTATFKKLKEQFVQLKRENELPIGVSQWTIFYKQVAEGKSWWQKLGLVLLKLIGLLLTGFAASVGAPFWFDLLRKVYTKKP